MSRLAPASMLQRFSRKPALRLWHLYDIEPPFDVVPAGVRALCGHIKQSPASPGLPPDDIDLDTCVVCVELDKAPD